MSIPLYGHPEPVPPASQLAVLPLIAAVDGFLRASGEVPGLRITIHRAMSREGEGYLQQLCAYVSEGDMQWKDVGRIFAANTGIIGAAYDNGCIWRTKQHPDIATLQAALSDAMPKAGDDKKPGTVALSYLAIPFLGPQKQVVLILYADCKALNFFSDDERINRVVDMCRGFCRLYDRLQKTPFPNLRNFPLQKGVPVSGNYKVYAIQECLTAIDPPSFVEVKSFNYESSVS